MKLLPLAAACLFATQLAAHGGQYRGPEDVVPPGGGGRGPGTAGPNGPGGSGPAGPSGPSTGGSPGPATAGPARPGTGGGRGATTRRGIEIADDVTGWEYWWEFNKDPYIRLKDAIHSGGVVTGSDGIWMGPGIRTADVVDLVKPSERDVLERVLPALKRAIDSTAQSDIQSACLVAMAKVGRDHPDFTLRSVFQPRLRRDDQEVRETAALAFGIAALEDAESVELLIDLATDSPEGRVACAKPAGVDTRSRAFATYGLGLVAHSSANPVLERRAFTALAGLTAADGAASDVQIAAVIALGLLRVAEPEGAGKALLADAVACLERCWRAPRGSGTDVIRAHCATSIAKLLGRSHADSPRLALEFAATLRAPAKGFAGNDLARSCALAAGELCPEIRDAAAAEAGAGKTLLAAWRGHRDAQTRAFALMALGRIGGAWVAEQLQTELARSKRAQDKAWVAMAMGVSSFHRREAETAAGRTPAPDDAFGRQLLDAFRDVRDPMARAGIAIGIGLCDYDQAADVLAAELLDKRHQEDLAGYLCISLALLGDRSKVADVRAVVQGAARRTMLLQQGAVALGKLGDRDVVPLLLSMLDDEEPNLAKLSAVASALGFIGDRRTIEPLREMLFDDGLGALSRAFAAVALGGVADKESLPWNSKIGTNLNYRAAVGTLTDKTAGILDIL